MTDLDAHDAPGRGAAYPPSWEDLIRGHYRRVATAFWFEFSRTLSPVRVSAMTLVALFPGLIMLLVRLQNGNWNDDIWVMALYLLSTEATTLITLLLWVAPAVQVELERHTWTYLSVRPYGKITVLLGKYLSGVAWSVSVGQVGLLVAVIVIARDLQSPVRIPLILASLQVLATFAYGALFLAIGVLFPRRAMLICVGFTLLFEGVLSLLPAVVNQLTVQHRLLNLLWSWMESGPPSAEFERLLGEQPPEVHLLCLAGYTASMLTIALVGIRRREYLHQVES